MSDSPVPAPSSRAQEEASPNNGLPPVAIMQRMLELQEKRLELDARQLDINERELDNNKSLGLRSMELNAAANTERTGAMVKIVGWRYAFWAAVAVFFCDCRRHRAFPWKGGGCHRGAQVLGSVRGRLWHEGSGPVKKEKQFSCRRRRLTT